MSGSIHLLLRTSHSSFHTHHCVPTPAGHLTACLHRWESFFSDAFPSKMARRSHRLAINWNQNHQPAPPWPTFAGFALADDHNTHARCLTLSVGFVCQVHCSLTISYTVQIVQVCYPHGSCDQLPVCIQNSTTDFIELNHLSSFHCLQYAEQN